MCHYFERHQGHRAVFHQISFNLRVRIAGKEYDISQAINPTR